MISCKNNFGETVTLPSDKFKFRPSVYGIIRHGNQLCVCRTKSKGKLWFAGGTIERGETIKEALVREITEETGLQNIQVGKFLGVFENFFYYQPTDQAMHAFLFFYECFTDEVALLPDELVNDDEVHNFHWLKLYQIKQADLADLNEELFKIISSLDRS